MNHFLLLSVIIFGFIHFIYTYSEASWQQNSDTVIQDDWKENSKHKGVKALEWKLRVENAKSGNKYLPIGNKVYIYEVSNPNSFVVKGRFFANSDSAYVVEFIERKPGVCLYSESQNTTKEFPQPGDFFNALDPDLMKDKSTIYYITINQPEYFVMDPFSSFTIRMFLQKKEEGPPYNVYGSPGVARRSAEKTDLRCRDSKIPADSPQIKDELNELYKNSEIAKECSEGAKKYGKEGDDPLNIAECQAAVFNQCLGKSELCKEYPVGCEQFKEIKDKFCNSLADRNYFCARCTED